MTPLQVSVNSHPTGALAATKRPHFPETALGWSCLGGNAASQFDLNAISSNDWALLQDAVPELSFVRDNTGTKHLAQWTTIESWHWLCGRLDLGTGNAARNEHLNIL